MNRPRPGSAWEDPETGHTYVGTFSGLRPYVCIDVPARRVAVLEGHHAAGRLLDVSADAEVIERLVPAELEQSDRFYRSERRSA
jgi:hypothetical protein